MDGFIKILLTILISSVKFAVGPAFAYYNNQYEFNNFQVILYCSAGGMLGVAVFSMFTPYLFRFFHWIKFEFYNLFFRNKLNEIEGDDISLRQKFEIRERNKRKSKKIFTRRNRMLVSIWSRYGLIGVAALTPVIISIPIGTIIATKYVHNIRKVYLYMFLSILFWSVTMTFTFHSLEVVSVKDVTKQLIQSKDSLSKNE